MDGDDGLSDWTSAQLSQLWTCSFFRAHGKTKCTMIRIVLRNSTVFCFAALEVKPIRNMCEHDNAFFS